MLYIVKDHNEDFTTTWHVGEEIGCYTDVSRVTEIQADGHELEYIRKCFPGLVIPLRAVVRWYGETAKFILGNL